ncbi:alpha/beta hydrolase [Paracoccaceae bacterium GXU_MW_L88]
MSWLLLAFLALAPGAAEAQSGASRFGAAAMDAEVDGLEMEIYAYRPEACASPSVLVVFHGNGRGAESYRNSAQRVADQSCFVIYSPLFDEERYPSWKYHRGGLVRDGETLDPETWTVEQVGELVDWIRAREGRDVPIYLFGHSAGGQFLSRYAAYMEPNDVARIVIANPSTYVLPNFDESIPYGFEGLPPEFDAERLIDHYLAAPVTIYLGTDDTGQKDLTMTRQAVRQGDNRLDRGRKTFELARAEAERRGVPFGWELVEAEGVGHTARGMLEHRDILEALGFDLAS